MVEFEISWDNIDKIDDCIITYLLYKEGKGMELISKIRNTPVEKVEKDIIKAKIKLRKIKLNNNQKSLLDKMLELTKEERLKFINNEPLEKLEALIKEIGIKYGGIKNPDDKAALIWLIGELKDLRLLSLLTKDILHNNGNVRRMVCSALGKMGDERAVPILHKALYDRKPQVRQYAAKALKKIGNETSINILNQLLESDGQKDYVKRAYLEAIGTIEFRLTK